MVGAVATVECGVTLTNLPGQDLAAAPLTARQDATRSSLTDARVFTARFFEMELARGLFDSRDSDGLRFWDVVRHDVYYRLWARISGGGVATGSIDVRQSLPTRLLRKAVHSLQTAAMLGKLRRTAPEYLFVTTARLAAGDAMVDPICQPYLDLLPRRSFVIETFSKGARYLRGEEASRSAFAAIPQSRWREETPADLVNEAFAEYFDVRLDPYELHELMRSSLWAYWNQLRYYDAVLRAHRPRAVVMVANGILKGLMVAAHRLGVPVIELQHGLISRLHPYYSYPRGPDYRDLQMHPNVLLTFADSWMAPVYFAGVRSVAIGTAHYRPTAPHGGRPGLLIVSANRYHQVLAAAASQIARRLPHLPILYKLHPQQYRHEQSIAAEFGASPNITVRAGERSISELFGEVSAMMCIQSTVVYEALQVGLRVFVLAQDDYQIHEDVFSYVELCDDAAHAAAALEQLPPPRPPTPSFFDAFDAAKALSVLSSPSAV